MYEYCNLSVISGSKQQQQHILSPNLKNLGNVCCMMVVAKRFLKTIQVVGQLFGSIFAPYFIFIFIFIFGYTVVPNHFI